MLLVFTSKRLVLSYIRLRVEYDTASTLRYSHAQIDVKSNPGDTNSWIIFVLACQICIVMMVVRMRMSHVCPCLAQANRRLFTHAVRGTQRRWLSDVMYDMRPLDRRAKGRYTSTARVCTAYKNGALLCVGLSSTKRGFQSGGKITIAQQGSGGRETCAQGQASGCRKGHRDGRQEFVCSPSDARRLSNRNMQQRTRLCGLPRHVTEAVSSNLESFDSSRVHDDAALSGRPADA